MDATGNVVLPYKYLIKNAEKSFSHECNNQFTVIKRMVSTEQLQSFLYSCHVRKIYIEAETGHAFEESVVIA